MLNVHVFRIEEPMLVWLRTLQIGLPVHTPLQLACQMMLHVLLIRKGKMSGRTHEKSSRLYHREDGMLWS